MPCNSGQGREQKTPYLCGSCKPLQRPATTNISGILGIRKSIGDKRRMFWHHSDKLLQGRPALPHLVRALARDPTGGLRSRQRRSPGKSRRRDTRDQRMGCRVRLSLDSTPTRGGAGGGPRSSSLARQTPRIATSRWCPTGERTDPRIVAPHCCRVLWLPSERKRR